MPPRRRRHGSGRGGRPARIPSTTPSHRAPAREPARSLDPPPRRSVTRPADPAGARAAAAAPRRSGARTASGAERERLWRKANEVWSHYDEYARKTDREIPVVVLERI